MKKINTAINKEQIEDIKNFNWFDFISTLEQQLAEELNKQIYKNMNLPYIKNRSTSSLTSQLWSYRPDVGWYDEGGNFRGLNGKLPKEKEIKRIYTKEDPYGEEDWDN